MLESLLKPKKASLSNGVHSSSSLPSFSVASIDR